ncbi:MAG: shikimate dehydrogenase [Actinobacteria bacterium]|nr:shikimate dehydrogenase [Actinomycetota bacterium]
MQLIRAAVLGSPISHSLSPLLHNRAYQVLGIAGEYSAIEVRSGELGTFLDSQSQEEWTGFSLTMPLKEEVLSFGFTTDQIALQSGSANTLVADGGTFRALSTDYLAFKNLLDISDNARVAVIGGGGTARSALAAVAKRVSGIDIYLRDLAKASRLQGAAPNTTLNPISYSDLTPQVLSEYDWIISAVPAGASDEIALSLSRADLNLRSTHLVEVLYNPWPTDLLMAARFSGAQIIDGLDILVEQALYQIEIFTQRNFDFSKMRQELLKTGLIALHS